MSQNLKPLKAYPTVPGKLFRIFAGYEIALVCLGLLFLLTLFGTLEQKHIGLYQAIEKYFDYQSLFVVPRLENGKILPIPMPGAYLVMAVLFINMTLGGIIRARKGWAKIGVLISHFSILFMLVAGAVSSIYKEEGMMFVFEGQQSDYAQSYFDPTIEVFAYNEDGTRGEPFVVPTEVLFDLEGGGKVDLEIGDFPFKVRVERFLRSSNLAKAKPGEGFDGFKLVTAERNTTEELNLAGAELTVTDNNGNEKKLLAHGGQPYPVTATIEGKRYGFLMTKKVWPMPYMVELKRSIGEYYPGTNKPSWFQSDVVKVDEDGHRESYEIVMNDPMRHGGFTLFQSQWSPPQRGNKAHSGFAIVKNPSDQWPKYALYASAIGLGIHFVMMLILFAIKGPGRKKKVGTEVEVPEADAVAT